MTELNWTLLALAVIGFIGAGWTYFHYHSRKPYKSGGGRPARSVRCF
jgi:hypothetical protein